MPQSKQKIKKQQGSAKSKSHSCEKPTSASPPGADLLKGLVREEADFLQRHVSFVFDPPPSFESAKGSAAKEYENEFVLKVAEALEQFHMCVLHDALSPDDVADIQNDYAALLDIKHGAHAIGEKDSSKRSGTRMWNCPCQLGPNCSFQGWRAGSENTRRALQRRAVCGTLPQHSKNKPPLWQAICNVFGFTHIARVEVVTSHVGCRNQDWHCDSAHGITVIFALVDIDLAKGPTEIEFITPFNSLGKESNSGKIKHKHSSSPESVHAVLPKGSVLMFNANANHRGTANLSSSDRPILVLDTSPSCDHLEGTCWEQE